MNMPEDAKPSVLKYHCHYHCQKHPAGLHLIAHHHFLLLYPNPSFWHPLQLAHMIGHPVSTINDACKVNTIDHMHAVLHFATARDMKRACSVLLSTIAWPH